MNLLDFVFRLGVVFAIYGFLWGIINIGIYLLGQGRQRSLTEIYIQKAIKYVLLVAVTFLFCIKGDGAKFEMMNQIIFAGLILVTYFMGKLQKNQNLTMPFVFAGEKLNLRQNTFNMKSEIVVIVLSVVVFIGLLFFPDYAQNPVSNWFYESIINIENTPVFGFIFKVIGFFFLLSLLFKMMNAFVFLMSGGKVDPNRPMQRENKKDDHFDDYEEIS